MSETSSNPTPTAPGTGAVGADDALGAQVREVHRRFPTGVTIVTTAVEGEPYGLAVNAFSSISLDPPLVLVCVAATSATYSHLFESNHVAVNVLANDQLEVAMTFARKGSDKFKAIAWRPGESGSPIIDGVAASLELVIQTRIPAATHTIFIGRVLHAAAHDRSPLVYLGGGFFDGGRLAPVASPSEG